MYTHVKVDVESKEKLRKLASDHKLTMLRMFDLLVSKEHQKTTKTAHIKPVKVKK